MKFLKVFFTLALILSANAIFAHNDKSATEITQIANMQQQIDSLSRSNWWLKVGYIPAVLIAGYVGFKLGGPAPRRR